MEKTMHRIQSTSPWFYGTRPDPGARLRLFCLPYAGGGASSYLPWISLLRPNIAVYPIQLPGRENRIKDRPFQDFDELVQTLTALIRPHMDLPIALFGHSMGALISFGIAQQLRREGAELPKHLFLSAYRAPQIPNNEALHSLPEAQLVQKILQMQGTDPSLLQNAELRALLLPLLRADFAVCESYQHRQEEPLDCPITVIGGLQDVRVNQAALQAWQEQTSQKFQLQMLFGNHFYWRVQPQPTLNIISYTCQNILRASQPATGLGKAALDEDDA